MERRTLLFSNLGGICYAVKWIADAVSGALYDALGENVMFPGMDDISVKRWITNRRCTKKRRVFSEIRSVSPEIFRKVLVVHTLSVVRTLYTVGPCGAWRERAKYFQFTEIERLTKKPKPQNEICFFSVFCYRVAVEANG